MVRIARKRIKGKIYYYIAKSIRLPGGKVVTITKNLGKKATKLDKNVYNKYKEYFSQKEKEIINYEHVFYRPEETSVREYEPL